MLTSTVGVRYKDLVDDEDHERLTRVLTALEKRDEMQQRMEAITKSVVPHCPPLPPPPSPSRSVPACADLAGAPSKHMVFVRLAELCSS